MDYDEAKAKAQKRADDLGMDQGVEKNELFGDYTTFGLPQKQHRYGHELRCEVVSCSTWDKILPGHGGKPS